MPRFLKRLCAAAAALVCLASPASGQAPFQTDPTQVTTARALSIDDILSMESFGKVSIDPTGRWLVYERRGGYDAAPQFDRGHRSIWAVTGLYLVDLGNPAPRPIPLLPATADQGVVLGPWSRTGTRLLVYRLREDRLEVGVVDLRDRSVHWTGLTPDMPLTGDFVAWRDDDRFVLTRRDDDSLPWILRFDGGSQTATTEAWRRMSGGRTPSRTVVETKAGITSAPSPARALSLVEVTASTGVVRRLLQGDVLDFALAPDGRHLAFLLKGEAIAAPTGPQRGSELLARGRLGLLDLDTGDRLTRSALDVALHLLRWSPSSDAVLIWAREDGQAWSDGGLNSVSTDGKVAAFYSVGLDPFPNGQGIDGLRGVRADWSGATPVLYAHTSGSERFDWYALSPDRPAQSLTTALSAVPARLAASIDTGLLLFSDGGLWQSRGAAAFARLTSAKVQVSDASATDVMDPLRLQMNDAPRQDWVFGRLASGGGLMLRPGAAGTHLDTPAITGSSYTAAATPVATISLVRDRGAETLWLGRVDGMLELDAANPGFRDLAFSRPTAIPHRDRLGRETRSWLYLPVGQGARDVKGLVVMIYPGSVNSGAYIDPRSLLFGIRPELIAAAGYAVLSPAMPESGEIGAAAAEGYVESVDLAVDATRARLPDLPTGRTAIIGHSFGGTAALAIAARSTRYQAYVAWSGVTDVTGAWGEFWPVSRALPEEGFSLQTQIGWAETGQAATGGPPWDVPDAYQASSPYLAAQTITAPVLLITGDRDFVPMSQSERVFTALHRQRKPARLVTYWGEGHFNWSPADIRDLYDQILAWLGQTLVPMAEPFDHVAERRDVHTRTQPSTAAAIMMSP